MKNMQTVQINETAKLSKAIRSGKPFYLADKDVKVLAYNPDMQLKELFESLERGKADITAGRVYAESEFENLTQEWFK